MILHIVEVNEHLDYSRFWKGREDTKGAGNAFWDMIEGLADSYPCPPCKPGAQALAHGGHDTVNLLLGKRSQTPKQFEMLYAMVNEAHAKYHGKRHKVVV